MRGYRDPTLQRKRWEAQADAWVCPNQCGHHVSSHREYQPTWVRGKDGPVELKHHRYRPGLFHCNENGCDCEFDANERITVR